MMMEVVAKVKVEDMNPGSPLNKLFTDFFNLNRRVLGTPLPFRDAGFPRYVEEQAANFYQQHHTPYGEELSKNFTEMVKDNPNEFKQFAKDSVEFKFFKKFWNLHRLYVNGDERQTRSDEYWEKALAEVNKTHHDFENAMEKNYVINILVSFIDELERRDKEEKKGACA